MKKRVLFHYSVFNRGGAEKSTLRLMKLFIKKDWDVTLVLNFKGGAMEEEIPSEIHVKYLSHFPIQKYANYPSHIIHRVIDCFAYPIITKHFANETYDLACIGLQGLNPQFICKCIRAKQRVIFIRSDIASCAKNSNVLVNISNYLSNIDKIICVSGTVKSSIDNAIPACASKSKVVYNVIDANEMRIKAENAISPFSESKYVKVVSVCRMVDKAKAVFRMLQAYDALYNKDVVFEWYFVGDGVDLPKMKEMVKGKPYEHLIHFEGEKKNPFPYYKYADLVAVLSYYEGLCGIVNEAKVSGAAVIATEFSGIHEQLTHGENGWIVENNLNAIVTGMSELIKNYALRNRLKNDLYPEAILNDDDKIEQILF